MVDKGGSNWDGDTGGTMRMTADRRDRHHGALLGLATGDALGTTLEFTRKGAFEPIDDMIGGGPFGLPPGYWTDDTSMALCWPRAWSSAACSIRTTR
jgi:ADP-ribosylglycohydrolase